jgi:catalase (peroxidase I)
MAVESVHTSGLYCRTRTPERWTNEYYRNLLGFLWEQTTSPGNKTQWIPVDFADISDLDPNTDYGFNPAGLLPDVVMLTTDLALLHDPSYREQVKLFARNGTALNETFAAGKSSRLIAIIQQER